jgi:hypothetical protein
LTRSFKKLVERHVRADPAFGAALIESLTEACEHADGEPGRMHVHVEDVPMGPNPSCGWSRGRTDDALSLPILTTNIQRVRHGC